MQIAAGGLVVAVSQQPTDHLQRHTLPSCKTGEGVAQVVDVAIGDFGPLADLIPEHSDAGQVAGGGVAGGEDPFARVRLAPRPQQRQGVVGQRSVVVAFLFGGRGWLAPHRPFKVDVVPAHGQHLAHPRPSEQQQAHHIRRILGRAGVDIGHDAGDFLQAQITAPGLFAVAGKAECRVFGDAANFDGIGQDGRQQRHHTVGGDGTAIVGDPAV